jgi:phenylalanyl-tRNA synthetase alpha chain
MTDADIVEQLNYFEKKVLKALHRLKSASPEDLLKETSLKQLVEVMNASSWLQAKGLVRIDESVDRFYSLRRHQGASKPLPERTAIEVLWKTGHGKGTLEDLRTSKKLKDDDVSIALGWMRKKGWVDVRKEGKEVLLELTEKGKGALEGKGEDELLIERLAKGEVPESETKKEVIDGLRSRKDILGERQVVSRRRANRLPRKTCR